MSFVDIKLPPPFKWCPLLSLLLPSPTTIYTTPFLSTLGGGPLWYVLWWKKSPFFCPPPLLHTYIWCQPESFVETKGSSEHWLALSPILWTWRGWRPCSFPSKRRIATSYYTLRRTRRSGGHGGAADRGTSSRCRSSLTTILATRLTLCVLFHTHSSPFSRYSSIYF